MLSRRTLLSFPASAFATLSCIGPRALAGEAESVPPPAGTILEISGKIRGSPRSFDLSSLKALGISAFETSTPWDAHKSTFEGVLIEALMHNVGCFGEVVRAYALDDYYVEVPVSDFQKYHVLLAFKRNGSYLDVADRGPLWIVYPFDTRPILNNNLYYGRSVWQLQRLVIA